MRRGRLLLLIPLLAFACARHETRTFARAPVILISIDTLRADHLPAYGYKNVDTPAIDAFRRDAILFENAYSHVPMTLPSHVALLTGLLPPGNGVRNNLGYTLDAHAHPAVSNLLSQNGYATGGAVSAYVLRGPTGLASCFQTYDDVIPARAGVAVGDLSRPGNQTIAIAQQWIAAHRAQPFFYFVHLFEPHTPYEPVEPFKSRYTSAYDGEIATADSYVGAFLDWLKQQKIYDDALIVVLSDHGEGLGDHGEQEHGVLLYRETLHVPLLIKLPHSQNAGASVREPVGLIDIAPTILSAVGGAVPKSMTGASLLGAVPPARSIYSETFLPRIHLGWSELRSLVNDRFHYIDAPRPELYDIVSDPAEKTSVVDGQRRAFTQLRAEMQPYLTAAAAPSKVDPEEAARLAALGYIGSVRTQSAAGPLPNPVDHIGELERMKDGTRLEASNDAAGALKVYQSLTAANPLFTDAWLREAAAYEELGDYPKAIDTYKHAIEIAPELADGIAISIANLQFKTGDLAGAEAHARLAMNRSPGAAHMVLAHVALSRHDPATAEKEARASMEDNTHVRDGAVVLAQVLATSGRLDEALRTVDGIARDTSPVENLDATRGDILARMQRNAEAEQAFRSELQNFPHNLDAYTKYAILLTAEGRAADARAALDSMQRANPGAAAQRAAAGTRKLLSI
ncbi:MAG TPA: sulfatase-like hydrolase/transferase [Thermoanaerobaculia bacterium]|jgi:arylsulfatase A-like enzyme/Flp pilus assembly protein TadD|nr:sulfatase-like hydrolase/transferase [Thermoanaerobaculia bacterium]